MRPWYYYPRPHPIVNGVFLLFGAVWLGVLAVTAPVYTVVGFTLLAGIGIGSGSASSKTKTVTVVGPVQVSVSVSASASPSPVPTTVIKKVPRAGAGEGCLLAPSPRRGVLQPEEGSCHDRPDRPRPRIGTSTLAPARCTSGRAPNGDRPRSPNNRPPNPVRDQIGLLAGVLAIVLAVIGLILSQQSVSLLTGSGSSGRAGTDNRRSRDRAVRPCRPQLDQSGDGDRRDRRDRRDIYVEHQLDVKRHEIQQIVTP